jgi:2-keto-4-pentenoate hydratase/2-oxohepta-3-ene-1,7-dioic acid hydratase in catechol pathway
MKICLYNSHKAGAVVGDKVYPIGDFLVQKALVKQDYTMVEIVDGLTSNPAVAKAVEGCIKSDKSTPLNKVTLRAPIYNPSAIWAAAANYAAHAKEDFSVAGHPYAQRTAARATEKKEGPPDHEALMSELFLKPPSSIIGPNETIIIPNPKSWVDYECELAAVIGKKAKNVSEKDSLDYVYGYTILMDISQREPGGSRSIRKGFDTYTPIGPWIVTMDEVPDPQNLKLKVVKNGEVTMEATSKDMICTVRELVRYLSNVITLRPGDIITTGTAPGSRKIDDGDTIKASIERVGEIELKVKVLK